MSRKSASGPEPIRSLRAYLVAIREHCDELRITTPAVEWPAAFESVWLFQQSLFADYGTPAGLRAALEPPALGALVQHGLPVDRVREDLNRIVGFVARFMTANFQPPETVIRQCLELALIRVQARGPKRDRTRGPRANSLRQAVFQFRRRVEAGAHAGKPHAHLMPEAISTYLAEVNGLELIIDCWLAEIDALSRRKTGASPDESPPRVDKRKKAKIPKKEREIRVRSWLDANAKGDPNAVSRDRIAAETGVSTGGVSDTDAWIAFKEERDKRRKPVAREIPLSERMQAAIPADCPDPAELAELIEAQRADRAKDERRRRPS